MTTDTEPRPVTAGETDLRKLGQQIIRTSAPGGDRAAAQALADEGSVLANKNVRRLLVVDSQRGATCRWENLAGSQYSLGLDEQQRKFLGLVLSMVGIGHITIAAVQDLDERRLGIILRAVLQLAGNDTFAVGTRV
jgi:hypothetical protein